ncbi:NAD(P)H-dependent glycerol-3-phosphate dehydrogenase [Deinococcus deserti]|uniref:Glycerol-3-phosphate dehydrogenase [NAD(P)+] n=1 Tax=Deinococcus deserti (strain DSM 17065 / CIP 109153 / LMG 22923 / VCD115) TaxID=546414 RepID=C1D0C7_DEIDV|nr:NAD(P)H-dependent glycerol-3-phosphate dehydrogenase [Deinococcus deserti]ACO45301.1 putative glycerol-3-phosphate dehydrogenase (NAD(P)(+)) [Deinococcus deserti VCD115]
MNASPDLPVLGAGGWGTALAINAARSAPVRLWARRPEFAAQLTQTRVNAEYLPGVTLPEAVKVTADLEDAVRQASFALVVVPSVGVLELLEALPRQLGVVLCAKGLAPDGGRLSELARDMGFARVAVLSGPNHAEEIARGLPGATVVASDDEGLALAVQSALMTPSLRVYTSTDVIGVELGGVLKNVIALAAGMVDGMSLGDNAKAALITRGLREMQRYLVALGAHEDTVYGLSGLGDLVATATSRHSRNRAAGEAIARGEHPGQGGKVVEGLRTAGLLDAWATAHGHDLPIVRAVAQVTRGEWTPKAGIASLMEREAKAERHD